MIYVVSAKLDSIKERWVGNKSRKKQYAFVLNLEWLDGSSSSIWRSYNDFFDFQCGLLDSFPEEAGTVGGFVRIIPYLPGIFAYLNVIGICVTNTNAWSILVWPVESAILACDAFFHGHYACRKSVMSVPREAYVTRSQRASETVYQIEES